MKREAVDEEARKYWESYFGPYGKAWVRSIPRRVAQAVIGRTAQLAPAEAAAQAVTARVWPIMPAPIITNDRVHLEGAVETADGARRLFHAEFDHDGRLLALDHLPMAAA